MFPIKENANRTAIVDFSTSVEGSFTIPAVPFCPDLIRISAYLGNQTDAGTSEITIRPSTGQELVSAAQTRQPWLAQGNIFSITSNIILGSPVVAIQNVGNTINKTLEFWNTSRQSIQGAYRAQCFNMSTNTPLTLGAVCLHIECIRYKDS